MRHSRHTAYPRHRRSPYKHRVNTRHPRYNVPNYMRGKGNPPTARAVLVKETNKSGRQDFPVPQEILGMKRTKYNEEGYAFYEKERGFGFSDGLEITLLRHKQSPSDYLVQVQHLASAAQMSKDQPKRWLIVRGDYFPDLDTALNNLNGIEVKPKPPKRKYAVPESMTQEEINEFAKSVEEKIKHR